MLCIILTVFILSFIFFKFIGRRTIVLINRTWIDVNDDDDNNNKNNNIRINGINNLMDYDVNILFYCWTVSFYSWSIFIQLTFIQLSR